MAWERVPMAPGNPSPQLEPVQGVGPQLRVNLRLLVDLGIRDWGIWEVRLRKRV